MAVSGPFCLVQQTCMYIHARPVSRLRALQSALAPSQRPLLWLPLSRPLHAPTLLCEVPTPPKRAWPCSCPSSSKVRYGRGCCQPWAATCCSWGQDRMLWRPANAQYMWLSAMAPCRSRYPHAASSQQTAPFQRRAVCYVLLALGEAEGEDTKARRDGSTQSAPLPDPIRLAPEQGLLPGMARRPISSQKAYPEGKRP